VFVLLSAGGRAHVQEIDARTKQYQYWFSINLVLNTDLFAAYSQRDGLALCIECGAVAANCMRLFGPQQKRNVEKA
jgi:hypothetical protein